MTKLTYVVVLSLLTVGCAAGQDDESDESSTATQLDLLEGVMPEPLQSAYALENEQSELDLDTQRALYAYGVMQRTDARPWLLLARDAMSTQTWSFALRYYNMAIEADPRAAQQQRVLSDVLQVVRVCSGATEQAEARALIESSYGIDAADAVNAALLLALSQQDKAGAERLRGLLERLDVRARGVRAAPACFAKPCLPLSEL